MNITIGENYLIKSDSMNYILYRKHVSDPNHRFSSGEAKESWEVVGYYKNFEMLTKTLVEREIRESEAESMKDIVKLIVECSKFIVRVVEVVTDGKEQD